LGPEGANHFLATSSAGGGLQVLVCGLAKRVTAESAQRAALGAGAILLDVISADDQRTTFERLELIRQARPDMVLLAGGIDGGEKVDFALEFCDLLNSAKPAPRFGQTYTMPVIYAGNSKAAPLVQDTLQAGFDLSIVPNLRPSFSEENLQPTRVQIHELFLNHVMAQAPGYAALLEQVTAPILPTPVAVGKIMTHLAEQEEINILGVDIGGATTDVFSVYDGQYHRTVSANIGMSYSAGNVLMQAGVTNVARWLPFSLSAQELQDSVLHKMLYPTTVPATLRDLMIEQALAREALRLALQQHNGLVVHLPDEQGGLGGPLSSLQSTSIFTSEATGLLDMSRIELIVGSGGVLSHTPRRAQAALILLDAFLPRGYSYLAVDSIFMMPHLGALSDLYPEIALEVLEKDCIIPLGPSFSLFGEKQALTADQACLEYKVITASGVQQGSLVGGEVRLLPIARDEEVDVILTPLRGLDIGAGRGRVLQRKVKGGVVGLILDARGRDCFEPQMAQQAAALAAVGAFTEHELAAVMRGED